MAPFSPFRTETETVLSDGGIETSLMYKAGMELREEAAFEALDMPKFADFLKNEETTYCRQAIAAGFSVSLDTPTYRASSAYFDKLGTPEDCRDYPLSKRSVALLSDIRDEVISSRQASNGSDVYLYGAIGPLGDAYKTVTAPKIEDARAYHRKQIQALAAAGVDAVCCYTFTNSNEAAAVALEAADAVVSCVVTFTLEQDGRLPCGETLGEAVTAVDLAADGNARVAYFGVNCIHPTAMRPILRDAVVKGEGWVSRVKAFRGNASAKSHEELEDSTEIDEGDPAEWAAEMALLRKVSWSEVAYLKSRLPIVFLCSMFPLFDLDVLKLTYFTNTGESSVLPQEFSGIQMCGGCCGTGV